MDKKNDWRNLEGMEVAALVSGGLDSTTIISWLAARGVKVLAFTLDLGQPDETDMSDIPERMKAAGAVDAVIIDGKQLLAEYMIRVIQGQAKYEGPYWNTTGIARMATVHAVLAEIKRRGITVITHGATGRGNDQVRFELATAMLAPELQVYAPWRDQDFLDSFGGRAEMIDYCQRKGLVVSATVDKPYSTDANFAGLTHEAGMLESIETPPSFIKFIMGVLPEHAPDQSELVSITFDHGRPVEVDGVWTELLDAFFLLNKIAGRNGVGIGLDQVENRVVGIKSRGVYESPGVTLLGIAYSKMLELVLNRDTRRLFDDVSGKFADVIYRGEYFGPAAQLQLGVIERIATLVTGTVTFQLYKGNVRFETATGVVHNLYNPDTASMENVGDFDHAAAQGYLEIAGVSARALAAAGQVKKN